MQSLSAGGLMGLTGNSRRLREQMRTLLIPLSSLLLPAVAGLFVFPGAVGSSFQPSAPGPTPVDEAMVPLPSSLPEPPGTPSGVTREVQDLRRELEDILRSTGNHSGKWSVLALSLDRGDTLLALHPREPMIPASNAKLLTTAAALFTLGPDFRYTSFLLTRGIQDEEVLQGDLVFYGTGDPTLSHRFFPGEMAPLDTLAVRILDQGIREVRGDLVIDGSYFAGPEIHPDWDPRDLNDPFAAPVAAVAFNENMVTVRVEAGLIPGRPPVIRVSPEGSGIPVLNTAVTTPPGTRSRVWLFRETPWEPIGIEGEIPLGGRDVWRELPVPDPLAFTGRELERALEARGIHITGQVRVLRDPAGSILPASGDPGGLGAGTPVRTLGVHLSPPLLEILRVVNKESNNFLAESVARTLGRITVGDGSFEGGIEAVERFLVSRVGVPSEEVAVRDGSGLSASNRVSAGALIQVLEFMAGSRYWDEFWNTLPEAGVRTELRRMGGTPASRNLRAKTGTMGGVSALTGMVKTRSGERVLFSILSNEVPSEYRAKRAEDRLGIRLASISRALN